MSSVKVGSGYEVTLFADYNFSGTSLVLTTDKPDLSLDNFDNETSSYKVEKI
jgi:hypothetical protein